ncbi:MAG: DUF4432 family protein [Phycisphaera sp.]|nr:DUF4432 family protein [Phycisphaera sp.]
MTFHQTIISSRLNVNVDAFHVSREQVTPDCPVNWSVRKVRLHGGRQEGVDLIVVDNGRMKLRIVATRGMNILDAECGDVRLGWDSPVTEVVHPNWIEPDARGGIGWLEGFNEYVARCGLEWFGAPCEDTHHHAPGEAPANNLTLHGKISNLPASEVEVLVQQEAPYRITIRGLVREESLFGPKFALGTEISTVPGESSFRVSDTITNRGSGEEEFCLLYHVNHGTPLLEDGARIVAAATRVTPMTERATEGGVENYAKIGPPTVGYSEQNYMLDLCTDDEGWTRVMLQNAKADRGVSLSWRKAALPCFTIWKNTQPESDGYVTGLEPGTNYPYPRPSERKAGRVMKLASGASHETSIEIAIQPDADAVSATTEDIAALQGDAETTYDSAPPA